ncbi:MAG: histidine kinase, partial [Actinomycetales bacterium]
MMPAREHSRAALIGAVTRLAIACLLLLDLTDSVVKLWGTSDPLGEIAQSLVVVMATLAASWNRPRWSAALGMVVMAGAFFLGPTGLEPWYVCCTVVLVVVRGRTALPLAHLVLLAWYPVALEVNTRRSDPDDHWYGITFGVVLIAISVGVGLMIRAQLARERTLRNRLRQAQERVATARADERARLAGELQRLVEKQFHGTLGRLRNADRHDARQLRSALDAVDEEARTSLTRLRVLLDALRAPESAGPVSDPEATFPRLGTLWLVSHRVQIALLAGLGFVLLRQVLTDGTSINPMTLFAACALGFALMSYQLQAPWIWLIAVLPIAGLAGNLGLNNTPLWISCVGALLGTLGGWAWRYFDDIRANTARRIAASDQEHDTVLHEERSALARELHDLVARKLSLITLRVMSVWQCQDTDTLAADCDDIEDSTHTARHELRTLVAGMQGGPEESDPGTHVVPPTITMECLANDLLAHGFTVRHR